MKKYLSMSNILSCLSFIVALIFVIIYAVNVGSAGYFQGRGADGVVLFSILVMLFDLIIIGRSFVKLEGIAAKCCDVVVMGLKVAVPALLILAAVNLLGARLEGLGYILFSNEDVKKEVATPENVASANTAITAIIFGIIAAVVSIVGAFFLPKEEQPQVEGKVQD